MQPTYVWTTVGYVIWPSAAKTFTRLLPMDMPVDNFMAWEAREGRLNSFVLYHLHKYFAKRSRSVVGPLLNTRVVRVTIKIWPERRNQPEGGQFLTFS